MDEQQAGDEQAWVNQTHMQSTIKHAMKMFEVLVDVHNKMPLAINQLSKSRTPVSSELKDLQSAEQKILQYMKLYENLPDTPELSFQRSTLAHGKSLLEVYETWKKKINITQYGPSCDNLTCEHYQPKNNH